MPKFQQTPICLSSQLSPWKAFLSPGQSSGSLPTQGPVLSWPLVISLRMCVRGGGGGPRTHPPCFRLEGSTSKDRKRRLPLLPNKDSVGSSFPFSSFAFLFLLFHFVINHLWCWPDTLRTLFFAVHESWLQGAAQRLTGVVEGSGERRERAVCSGTKLVTLVSNPPCLCVQNAPASPLLQSALSWLPVGGAGGSEHPARGAQSPGLHLGHFPRVPPPSSVESVAYSCCRVQARLLLGHQ